MTKLNKMATDLYPNNYNLAEAFENGFRSALLHFITEKEVDKASVLNYLRDMIKHNEE